jgi:hypothetical protein
MMGEYDLGRRVPAAYNDPLRWAPILLEAGAVADYPHVSVLAGFAGFAGIVGRYTRARPSVFLKVEIHFFPVWQRAKHTGEAGDTGNDRRQPLRSGHRTAT